MEEYVHIPRDRRKPKKKVAARIMLPLEMCCGLISMMIGISAGFGRNALWDSLQKLPTWFGHPQNEYWALVLVSVGLILFVIAAYELLMGYEWERETIHVFADMRCLSALFLVIAHTSLFTTLLVKDSEIPEFTLAWLSPMVSFFSCWSAFFTRRLSIALNPKYYTPGLEDRLSSH